MLIAGGGFGAVEAMLALRALAPERVRVTLISASPVFAYKPAATAEAFEKTPPRTYDLEAIADDAGASFRVDRLEAVAPDDHSVRLASFAYLDYDALVLAIGARTTIAIPGALTFHDQREVHHIRRMTRLLRAGKLQRIVFAVPSGCSWPLPLYELALFTATQLREGGAAGEVVLVSPEPTPLQVFGAQASRLVADLLAERDVRFVGESDPRHVERGGALALGSGETVEADCVVAVPELRGPRITGVPTDREGFITTDALGGVIGLSDVYAAGDMTSFPIKQGGLAAQQADLIAQRIASTHATDVKEPRAQHVLRAQLIGGAHPIFLRTELDEFGQPTTATLQRERSEDSESLVLSEKVFGRYLTTYLHTREPVLAHSLTDG
ncbi:MAG TPA: FAD-dependent oxidoreductase [Solirubrobacteraceae bacterium]|nr:FAD-dependent oxidoreductase [Solirubrobacteraceae bacterium]